MYKRGMFFIKTTNTMGIVKTIVTGKTKTKARARVELQGITTIRKIGARTQKITRQKMKKIVASARIILRNEAMTSP